MVSKKKTVSSGKKFAPVVIQGLVKWAKVFEPDSMSGKYTVNVYLDEKSIKVISEMGVPIKSDDGGSFFVPFAYSANTKGESIDFTEIYNANMDKWKQGMLIGNGSLCNVEVFVKSWSYQGKTGFHARLLRLQVLKHIEYGVTKLKPEPDFIEASDESSVFEAQDQASSG